MVNIKIQVLNKNNEMKPSHVQMVRAEAGNWLTYVERKNDGPNEQGVGWSGNRQTCALMVGSIFWNGLTSGVGGR